MALGAAQPQAARPNHLAIALCAGLLLAVSGNLGFGMASETGGAGHGIESTATMGNDFVTAGDTRHGDDNCGLDHESPECSPCPSCSGALPSTAAGDSDVIAIVRAPIFQSHYDDVVPRGIRRPPKLS